MKKEVYVLRANRIYRGQNGYSVPCVSFSKETILKKFREFKNEVLDDMSRFCDDKAQCAKNVEFLSEGSFVYEDGVNYRHEVDVIKDSVGENAKDEVWVVCVYSKDEGEEDMDPMVCATEDEAREILEREYIAAQNTDNDAAIITDRFGDGTFEISDDDEDYERVGWIEKVKVE